MDYVWCILAALWAGVGTGLAGLSAATVMVPILMVLCPAFSGENGVYQATAIALASDIFGSAVTAFTYARHGNMDLKRGRVMMVCVLLMCTVGSYAAYIAGNVVLGNFSLFLTLCIGIRFLVKPDTGSRRPSVRGARLDGKAVAWSLFFGLTVGFGTGFVGTGGGMIMLIVFTVFLGMDQRTAVGTSTFIMTFTALIAAVSHILIHPAIVLEKWDMLLLCMTVATSASLLSARFANRMKNRTVGLATGGVLTVLGASMLLLYYRDVLASWTLLPQILRCFGMLLMFIIPALMVLVPIRFLTRVPSYVFRKLLHMMAFSFSMLVILRAESWQAAALTALVSAAVIYPILCLCENRAWYGKLMVQKSPGEVKRSMLMIFSVIAAVVGLAWGVGKQQHLAAAAIMMWGCGDAAAALVGIPWGRHKVHSRWTDGKKSWEGTLAMAAVSFLSGISVLLWQHTPVPQALYMAGLGAVLGSATELFSHSEYDTVTVPLVIVLVLLACTAL